MTEVETSEGRWPYGMDDELAKFHEVCRLRRALGEDAHTDEDLENPRPLD